MPPFTFSRVLVLIALILAVLASINVGFAGVNLIAAALAVYFAHDLVP